MNLILKTDQIKKIPGTLSGNFFYLVGNQLFNAD